MPGVVFPAPFLVASALRHGLARPAMPTSPPAGTLDRRRPTPLDARAAVA